MIDINASRIARMEHEERVRALAREEQFLNDILPDEFDAWMSHSAGNWQAPQLGDLVSSVSKSLGALRNRLKARQEAGLKRPIAEQKRRGIAG